LILDPAEGFVEEGCLATSKSTFMIYTKQPSTTQNVMDSTRAWCEGIAAGRRILADVDSLCE
jgi:hypothetical protein